MSLLPSLLMHLTLFWILGALIQFALLLSLRIKITAVSLFFGRTPLKFNLGGCEISIGWLPFGTSISFDPIDFYRRSLPVRLFAHFSSAIIGAGAACALLGMHEAWSHLVSGFWQIPAGAWHPIERAAEYLISWQTVAATSPIRAFGIVAAKGAALALLPIGGGALTQILADLGTSLPSERFEKLALLNALVGIMILLAWAFAGAYLEFAG